VYKLETNNEIDLKLNNKIMSVLKRYGGLKSIQIKKHLCAPLVAKFCYITCLALCHLDVSKCRIKLPLTFLNRFLRLHYLGIESDNVLINVD